MDQAASRFAQRWIWQEALIVAGEAGFSKWHSPKNVNGKQTEGCGRRSYGFLGDADFYAAFVLAVTVMRNFLSQCPVITLVAFPSLSSLELLDHPQNVRPAA